ncbi:hypothetical protein Tco_0005547 [Tanacetum coccineum]
MLAGFPDMIQGKASEQKRTLEFNAGKLSGATNNKNKRRHWEGLHCGLSVGNKREYGIISLVYNCRLSHKGPCAHQVVNFKKDCPKLKNGNSSIMGNGQLHSQVPRLLIVPRRSVRSALGNETLIVHGYFHPIRHSGYFKIDLMPDYPDKGLYQAQFLTLESSGLVCQKEGWIILDVHRLPGIK